MKLNNKNKLLILGSFILLYICYVYAFSKTLDYYAKYNENKNSESTSLNNPDLLKQLIAQEKQLNKLLETYSPVGGNSFQNNLLSQLSTLSEDYSLRIIDFKEPFIYTGPDVIIANYMFTLQGSFNAILLLINRIDNNESLGHIKHISFMKKKNYKTNSDYLITEILLQKNNTIEKQ